jgi:hypothetical protein
MEHASKENDLKGFSGGAKKGNKTDTELNVQRARHETAEVLRQVLP